MPVLPDLLIREVRPSGAGPVDVLVQGGRIAATAANLAAPSGCMVEDGDGALLLPGLVEGHTHLDKTLWGMDWYRNEVGPRLIDRIDNERAFRQASGHDAGAQSMALARAFLARGTTRLRTHVDVDTEAGLRHLEGVLRTRDALREVQQIQIVAFPQSGLLRRPGTAELLDAALARGGDVLGGLDPCAIDGDPVRSLDTLFAIAERHGVPLDIHLHEPGAMGAFSLELILERTAALGLRYNLRRDDELALALDCVTHAGARGCGFADYGLAPGDRADLVLVDAQTVAQAVVARPVPRLVVAGGRVVARRGELVPGIFAS